MTRDEWRKRIDADPVEAYAGAFGPAWAVMLEALPEHMRRSVAAYILLGDLPGDFLRAVICNDLMQSFACADDVNRRYLFSYVTFLHAAAPPAAFRSEHRMNEWTARGGMVGVLEAEGQPT